jgi:dienelactone hydrolase
MSTVVRTFFVILTILYGNFCVAQSLTPRYESMAPYTNGYYEHLPDDYNMADSKKYPLILFIHGGGDLGNGGPEELPRLLKVGLTRQINIGFPSSFTVNGQTFKFIIIAPQFTIMPQKADAINSIAKILSYVSQHYKVDPSRIYLTGLSKGGGFTLEYAGSSNAAALQLAAIVTSAEASVPDRPTARTIAANNLPVWATHNQGDEFIPASYTNDYIALINEAPAPVPPAKKTLFPGSGHDSWTQTYNPGFRENGMNIYEWMLQYYRVPVEPPPPPTEVYTLTLYPVPVKDNLQLKLEGSGKETVNVSIYNSIGMLMKTIVVQKNGTIVKQPINVMDLSAGLYILQVKGQQYSQKRSFIKY